MTKEKEIDPVASELKRELNLYEKLALIAKNVKILKKSKSGYNYTYVPAEDILAGIQGRMEEYGVSLIPTITSWNIEYPARFKVKYSSGGERQEFPVNDVVITGGIKYTWVDNHNPTERIDVPWAFFGQQEDASQAFGSALTYAERYFLLKYFQIATSNDPDEIIAKKKELESAEERRIAKDIILEIDRICGEFTKANPDRREEIIEVLRKNAKDENGRAVSDYHKIAKPDSAAALLGAVNKYINGGK